MWASSVLLFRLQCGIDLIFLCVQFFSLSSFFFFPFFQFFFFSVFNEHTHTHKYNTTHKPQTCRRVFSVSTGKAGSQLSMPATPPAMRIAKIEGLPCPSASFTLRYSYEEKYNSEPRLRREGKWCEIN